MARISVVLLTLAVSCLPPPAEISVLDPVVVEPVPGTAGVVDPAPRMAVSNACGRICVVLDGEHFCDSDCDGWYDSVEVEFGYNPCDPSDPPSSPGTLASTVCSRALLKEVRPEPDLYAERAEQMCSLAALTGLSPSADCDQP